MALFIGTSGWSYRHWRPVFYPPDVPQRSWLAYYADRFSTVEINATFYRLQKPEVFANWAASVPAGFRFAVKCSRYLTHTKRLLDAGRGLERLLGSLEPLGDRRGPLLVQLPGSFPPDAERLSAFLASCPKGLEVAVEPRDPRWFVPEVEETLRHHRAGLVRSDFPGAESPAWETAPFLYVRRHGSGGRYSGHYESRDLEALAATLSAWETGDAYCYFNNDAAGAAPQDARALIRLCEA